MFPDVVLKGRTVRLRPVIEADLPFFLQWLSDPDVYRWLGISDSGPPASLEQETAWYAATKDDSTQFVWSIETDQGHLLGNIALHRGFRPDAAELEILIGEKQEWNKGYGTDAVRTVLRHAFSQMDLRRVYLHSDVDNHTAHRSFEKCGFRREGIAKVDGHFVDNVRMAILAHEFTD